MVEEKNISTLSEVLPLRGVCRIVVFALPELQGGSEMPISGFLVVS